SMPGFAWTALVALAIFAMWFAFDPNPAAIWREFVVGENLGKMKAGRSNYLLALLWGRMSVWGYALSWFLNAGLLALPLLGTVIRAWQHRAEAGAIERLLWLWAAVLFAVFCMPTQRSGRYLLEAMPGIAVVMALHWHRLLPSAFLTTVAGAGVVVGLVVWLSALLVRDLGPGDISWIHWGILGGAAGIVLFALADRRRLAACAVPAALVAFLVVSSFLTAFDPPRGGYPAAAVAAARGRVV
ncbi:MAG: glycosyl transferase family 39, partial [Planctomycetia bacterium]